MNTEYILLSPYVAPRRVTRGTFVATRPKLQRCNPSVWVEATLGAIMVDRSIKLATTVAHIHAKERRHAAN